jgi:hypothetical protein
VPLSVGGGTYVPLVEVSPEVVVTQDEPFQYWPDAHVVVCVGILQ